MEDARIKFIRHLYCMVTDLGARGTWIKLPLKEPRKLEDL